MLAVSVIVPVYRDWNKIPRLIEALEKQNLAKNQFEVILVDNSNDEALIAEKLACFRDVAVDLKILQCVEPGSYCARNMGIANAAGEFLAFTDADCCPTPQWLERGMEFLAKNRSLYSRLGGAVHVDATPQGSSWVAAYEKVFAFPQREYVQRDATAATANMMARADIFGSVGLFDSTRKSGGDMEWGFRAERAGSHIGYCGDAVVLHSSRTFREHVGKNKRVARGRYRNKSITHRTLQGLRRLAPPIGGATRKALANEQQYSVVIKALAVLYLLRISSAASLVVDDSESKA